MGALTLALAVLAGTRPAEETDLPRRLTFEEDAFRAVSRGLDADSNLPPWEAEPQAAKGKADLTWWVGGHLGVASAYDSDNAVFVVGGHGRVRILPWLGAEASLDFHTFEFYEKGDIRVFAVPLQFSALFYPPVDWAVQPYGVAGFGIYIDDITYHGALKSKSDKTDVEVGLHIGFGAEYEIAPNLLLNADLRFVFQTDPGGVAGNSFDFIQFTVGVSWKLGK